MRFSEEQLVKTGKAIIDYICLKIKNVLTYDSTAYDMGKETILEIIFNFDIVINYTMETRTLVIINKDNDIIDESEKFNIFLRKSKIETILNLE